MTAIKTQKPLLTSSLSTVLLSWYKKGKLRQRARWQLVHGCSGHCRQSGGYMNCSVGSICLPAAALGSQALQMGGCFSWVSIRGLKNTRVTRPWCAAGLQTLTVPGFPRDSQKEQVCSPLPWKPLLPGRQKKGRSFPCSPARPASHHSTTDPNSSCWHVFSGCFRASLFVNAFLCSAIGTSTACSQPVPAAPQWLRWQAPNKAWALSRSSMGSGRSSKHPGGSSSLFQPRLPVHSLQFLLSKSSVQGLLG